MRRYSLPPARKRVDTPPACDADVTRAFEAQVSAKAPHLICGVLTLDDVKVILKRVSQRCGRAIADVAAVIAARGGE